MNPMLLPLLVGGLVIAMVVMLFFALRRGEDGRAADRLDQLPMDRSQRMRIEWALSHTGTWIDPTGDWWQIQADTGLPVADAIVDWLVAVSTCAELAA